MGPQVCGPSPAVRWPSCEQGISRLRLRLVLPTLQMYDAARSRWVCAPHANRCKARVGCR